ncbi:Elongation factor 1-gamma 3 [Platanthera guangdongensis]|uniref:Elongation factor 1-gamma 3 n=1 Tax=Platanthera guangdongensis TaxID=2320717 RepID=A0ABR2MX46_9ASPA
MGGGGGLLGEEEDEEGVSNMIWGGRRRSGASCSRREEDAEMYVEIGGGGESEGELLPAAVNQDSAEFEERGITQLKKASCTLNTHLGTKTFQVGHSITLDDIIIGCNLCYGFSQKITGEVNQVDSVPPIQSGQSLGQPKEPVKSKEVSKKVVPHP